jgi:hypothetical protein
MRLLGGCEIDLRLGVTLLGGLQLGLQVPLDGLRRFGYFCRGFRCVFGSRRCRRLGRCKRALLEVQDRVGVDAGPARFVVTATPVGRVRV